MESDKLTRTSYSESGKNYLNIVAIISFVYGIITFISAVYFLENLDAIMNLFGTEESLRGAMAIGSAIMLTGAVLAVITGILAIIKKSYIATLICSIIFTIAGIISVVGLIVGIIVTVLVIKSKDTF